MTGNFGARTDFTGKQELYPQEYQAAEIRGRSPATFEIINTECTGC
jgi:hypothetical protein